MIIITTIIIIIIIITSTFCSNVNARNCHVDAIYDFKYLIIILINIRVLLPMYSLGYGLGIA